LGAVFEYAGISVGGEFLNNLKSGQLRALQGGTLGKVSTIGMGYKFGANAVSLAYLHSKRKLGRLVIAPSTNYGTVKTNNWSLTYDRALAPGLDWYAEGVAFKMKASNPSTLADWNNQNGFDGQVVANNRGHVGVTGLRVKF